MFIPSLIYFFFSSRRRHTRSLRDWSSDVCSSDLEGLTFLDREGLAGEVGDEDGDGDRLPPVLGELGVRLALGLRVPRWVGGWAVHRGYEPRRSLGWRIFPFQRHRSPNHIGRSRPGLREDDASRTS